MRSVLAPWTAAAAARRAAPATVELETPE